MTLPSLTSGLAEAAGLGYRPVETLELIYMPLAPAEPSILMVNLCAHTPSICDGTFTGTQLHIHDQGLNGTIPTELFQHTQLTELGLDDFNQLSGTVPTEIGLLTRLDALNLGVNQFTGTVPTEIGRLTQLISLELYGNSLRARSRPSSTRSTRPSATLRRISA